MLWQVRVSNKGVTAVGFSYPFELLRVRLAFQIKNESNAISIKSTFLKIFNEPNELFSNSTFLNRIGAGIGNFYRGFLATVLGIAPYAGISFLTYESLKSSLMEKYSEKSNKKRLNTNVELLIGGVAGAAGQTVSYPLEIIRRHIQVAGITGQGKRLSIIETARDIFKQRGIRGFFVGLTIGYIKVVPLSAVSFVTYDFMKRVMEID